MTFEIMESDHRRYDKAQKTTTNERQTRHFGLVSCDDKIPRPFAECRAGWTISRF